MEDLFECRSLTKKYGRKTALNEISLKLQGGKIVGLLGPNGSGKTTLIKLASGLLTPTFGDIIIDGNTIGIETKKVVSYLPDICCLPDEMTVDGVVGYYKTFFDDFNEEKADLMIENLGIDKKAKIKSLSKGNKEKVQLILTMSRDAKVYLLDEPIGGVDPATRDYIINTIITNYNENALVIISTHIIQDVEKILDEVVFINNGNIVLYDTVDNIRSEKGKSLDEVFREVFKC